MPCAVRKPYSTSPSHQLIRMIISQVFDESLYHIVIFGSCGIVPAELETMYPFAHYKYMLGKCDDDTVKADFLKIETDRVAGYLEKTRHLYRYRIAYCIGLFREALIRGSEKSGVKIDLLLPTKDLINRVIEDEECRFQEGSLSMDKYPGGVLQRPRPVPECTSRPEKRRIGPFSGPGIRTTFFRSGVCAAQKMLRPNTGAPIPSYYTLGRPT